MKSKCVTVDTLSFRVGVAFILELGMKSPDFAVPRFSLRKLLGGCIILFALWFGVMRYFSQGEVALSIESEQTATQADSRKSGEVAIAKSPAESLNRQNLAEVAQHYGALSSASSVAVLVDENRMREIRLIDEQLTQKLSRTEGLKVLKHFLMQSRFGDSYRPEGAKAKLVIETLYEGSESVEQAHTLVGQVGVALHSVSPTENPHEWLNMIGLLDQLAERHDFDPRITRVIEANLNFVNSEVAVTSGHDDVWANNLKSQAAELLSKISSRKPATVVAE